MPLLDSSDSVVWNLKFHCFLTPWQGFGYSLLIGRGDHSHGRWPGPGSNEKEAIGYRMTSQYRLGTARAY